MLLSNKMVEDFENLIRISTTLSVSIEYPSENHHRRLGSIRLCITFFFLLFLQNIIEIFIQCPIRAD